MSDPTPAEQPCEKCKGKRVVADITRKDAEDCIVPCPDCRGSGDETEDIVERDSGGVPYPAGAQPTGPCERCKGSGHIEQIEDRVPGIVIGDVPCPACQPTPAEQERARSTVYDALFASILYLPEVTPPPRDEGVDAKYPLLAKRLCRAVATALAESYAKGYEDGSFDRVNAENDNHQDHVSQQ